MGPSLKRTLVALLGCGVFLLAGMAPAHAQKATLRGFVTDAEDGQAFQGVNVYLETVQGELFGGASTNVDGFYAISRIPPGRYVLHASFIGYQSVTDTLTLAADETITRSISMHVDASELGEVVVESEQDAGAATSTAGLQVVRPEDIARVPTVDVSADLVGYLQTLPGVVSGGDRGGQYFVRGGTPTQNLALLDGMIVYQPFHIIGFYSAFPADIISEVNLYAGGFGAEYGGRLSSVVDVAAHEGNKQRYAGSVAVTPFLTSALVEGPLWPGRVSLLASWRESLIEQAGPAVVGQELPYRFGDRFAKVHATVSPSFRLSVAGLQTHDRGVITPGEDEDELTVSAGKTGEAIWENEAYTGRFLFLPAGFPMLGELQLGFARLRNEFVSDDELQRFSSVSEFDARVEFNYFLRATDVNAGLFLRTARLEYQLNDLFEGFDENDEYVTEVGFFMEADMRLAPGLSVTPGLRVQSFPSLGRTSVEPRARAVWRIGGETGRHELSAAWGLYHQGLVGLNDRRDAGNVFTAWVAPERGHDVPSAQHYIAGYRVEPVRGLQFSVEGFYKMLGDVRVPDWAVTPNFQTALQTADGTVRGVDLRLELTKGAFYGYASYGYAAVEYDAVFTALGEAPTHYSPPHDRRHQVNALGSLSVWDFDVSLRWQFGSGQPFSEAMGFDTWVPLPDPSADVGEEPGIRRVLYLSPYEGRLPTYHRLDASLERTFPVSRNVGVTMQASVINIYDRSNLFYLDLFTLRRVDQLPLIPSLGLKVAFK